jgi:hypothetical protein
LIPFQLLPGLEVEDFLVLFEAYFDDSGTDAGSPAVTCAGYVALRKYWRALDSHWKHALKSYHLKYFRMSEFAQRTGQFKGWNEEKRRRALNLFMDIIREHVEQGLVASVYKSDYDSLVADEIKKEVGGSFALCANLSFAEAELFITGQRKRKHVRYVFENGTLNIGQIAEGFRRAYRDPYALEWRSLDFMPKVWRPLQAADMIAYEACKALNDLHKMQKQDLRYPFKTLIAGIPHQLVRFRPEFLSWMNQEFDKVSSQKSPRSR